MSDKEQLKENFRKMLADHVSSLKSLICSENGSWKIKGFIDSDSNVYTISLDTKVISKIVELILYPKIAECAQKNGYKVQHTTKQNYYPDMTFIDAQGNFFAVDVKSTYRKSKAEINGMTLGTFTGYFRERTKTKNIVYPYERYTGHFVLGLIYNRSEELIHEHISHKVADLDKIPSVANNFEFFVQEKYKIATDKTGSGNTKNIGSVKDPDELLNGRGPFSGLGEQVFDDYWMNYLTQDMLAKAKKIQRPYKNLLEYHIYKKSDSKK